MYDNKLVVAVLANGKVLREHKDEIYLPFGQEFTLRFKNLATTRALVRVEVDGQDATEGTTGLIVPPNSSVDLERFIKGGNLAAGNRFKFIERTAKIEDGPRGIKAEDGLIRVEFEFERMPAQIVNGPIVHHYPWYVTHYPSYPVWNSSPLRSVFGSPVAGVAGTAGTAYSMTTSNSIGSASLASTAAADHNETKQAFVNQFVSDTASCSAASTGDDVKSYVAQNAAGITVPGSLSEQSFTSGAWFPTDGQKHSMVLRLLGTIGQKPVKAPVTVKTKQVCGTCGTNNKHGTKFCRECGAALQVV